MCEEKIRKVFLDDLPRNNKGIDWNESIGHIVKFIYDDIEGEIKIINYIKKGQWLVISWEGKEFNINSGSFKKCSLGQLLGTKTNEFKINLGKLPKLDNNDSRDMTILDRKIKTIYKKSGKKENQKWYRCKCNKCGWEDSWTIEHELLNGTGCACCCPTPRVVVPGINDIPTTNPDIVKFFQGGEKEASHYTKGTHKKIYPKCPICNTVSKKAVNVSSICRLNSISCVNCSDGISIPEKLMYSILDELNIEFQREYSPKWVRPKRYDFYIPSKKLIIEMDGGFHRKDNKMSGQTKEESTEIDNYKDELAQQHGLKVIRIKCEYANMRLIKNNILLKLSEILDLSNINWHKCYESTCTNLVKEICNYWDNKEERETTKDLSGIFKISSTTIVEYLKKGTKLGWCNYDGKYEAMRNYKFAQKANCKAVEIFRDDVSLGVFKSCIDLETKSENLFGIKLLANKISSIARGDGKSHHGFTFKYVDKENTKTTNKSSRTVEIFKNGISLGIFQSPSDLQRQSEELFGVKFLSSKISSVALGRRPHHHGFTFRYIDSQTTDIDQPNSNKTQSA